MKPLATLETRIGNGQRFKYMNDENDTKPKSAAQLLYGDIAPQLAIYSDTVLNGDLWERRDLSKRDRSLITCAALVCLGKTEQMGAHFPRAIDNGVTKKELVEMITHLAFYAGWPSAVSAIARTKEYLGD
jgi:4-carboxymuconolactone decarboxylase